MHLAGEGTDRQLDKSPDDPRVLTDDEIKILRESIT
jgi:hypothetical protein